MGAQVQALCVPETSIKVANNKVLRPAMEATQSNARYQGKTVVLLAVLVGFGFAALLSLSGAGYTEEPSIAMAAAPLAQSMKSMQFLRPLARTQSMTRATPLTKEEKALVMKEERTIENDVRKAMTVAAGVLAHHPS